MWEKDGFEFTEHDRVNQNGITWLLLTAYSRDFTDDYGRHMGITLALKDNEIVAHAMCNLQRSTNPTTETINWFKANVSKGVST